MNVNQDLLQRQDALRQSITVGWICALQLVVIMFVVALLRAAIGNDFTGFSKDPGDLGMRVMLVVFTIYAVIPIALRMIGGVVFRWAMVGVAVFFLLMFVAHQLSHMYMDGRPLNFFHTLDFAHHGMMLWLIVLTVRWARLAQRDVASASARPGVGGLAVGAK